MVILWLYLKSLEPSIEIMEKTEALQNRERDKDSTSQIKAKFKDRIGWVIIPLATTTPRGCPRGDPGSLAVLYRRLHLLEVDDF